MNIFFGMAISDVPMEQADTHFKSMDTIIELIRAEIPKAKILSSQQFPAPINRETYSMQDNRKLFEWYRDLIFESDIFVAEVSYPSTGLGIELHIAVMLEKPIFLFSKNQNMSRMVNGLPRVKKAVVYSDIRELEGQLLELFSDFSM